MTNVSSDILLVLVGILVGWYFGRIIGRRGVRTASDLVLASAAPPPLYRVDTLDVSVEFDEEGSGTYSRSESGIEPISDLQEVVVPYRFSVTPQGTLDEPSIRTLSPNNEALWRPTTVERTRTEGTLLLRGRLQASSTTTGYALTQRFQRAFYMTKQETLDAYKDSPMRLEYLGVVAYVPTRFLRFTVKFPASHHQLADGPRAFAFVGETEYENVTETDRIKAFLKVEPGLARLELESPRRGVRYAIAWLAPSREK